jgi:hypothetical protein
MEMEMEMVMSVMIKICLCRLNCKDLIHFIVARLKVTPVR